MGGHNGCSGALGKLARTLTAACCCWTLYSSDLNATRLLALTPAAQGGAGGDAGSQLTTGWSGSGGPGRLSQGGEEFSNALRGAPTFDQPLLLGLHRAL